MTRTTSKVFLCKENVTLLGVAARSGSGSLRWTRDWEATPQTGESRSKPENGESIGVRPGSARMSAQVRATHTPVVQLSSVQKSSKKG